MNIKEIRNLYDSLPATLKDSIINYVISVENVVTDIFKDAGIKHDELLEEKILFIASLKKFYSIIKSTYWLMNNSNELLRRKQQDQIKIGNTNFSYTSSFFLIWKS